MSNPLTQDGAPRTIVILLAAWLMTALAVAAGMVLGAWVIMQYIGAVLAEIGEGVGRGWTP